MKIENKKIVVALGGNAILTTRADAQAQKEALVTTSKSLVKLLENGNDLVITHGNGPQVGNLLLQQLAADSEQNPAFPLDSLVAMTEGSIGFWLENAMINELASLGMDKEVAALISEVIVDKADPAFAQPTKPIGPFLTEAEAKAQAAETGASFKEDAGRGWRKVVASPQPIGIKGAKVIKKLVDDGVVVIAAGGGGVPVYRDELTQKLIGIEAVIDKDFASERLAELIEADLFLILTGVDHAYINFNQPNQTRLERLTASEAKAHIAKGEFAPGSMLPKIEAAIAFVEHHPAGKAVITSLAGAERLMSGDYGTIIVAD